jgi:hypothetical protein
LLAAVEEVFSHYRDAARSGAREMEKRFNLQLEPPRPQSRMRIGSDAIHLSVRYPVDVRMRVQVTDEISRRLLEAIRNEPSIRLVPPAAPAIQQAGQFARSNGQAESGPVVATVESPPSRAERAKAADKVSRP